MKLILIVILTVVATISASGIPSCETLTQVHDETESGTQSLVIKWLPLEISNNLVVGIGSHRLPIAVRLPQSVRRATRFGLFLAGGAIKPGHFNVEIFFRSFDDSKVRHWVQNLPEDMPLDTSRVSYKIIRPTPFNVKIGGVPKLNIWSYELVLRTSRSKASYYWLGIDNLPKNTPPGTDTEPDVDWSKLFNGAGSPVRDQERLVSLRVYF